MLDIKALSSAVAIVEAPHLVNLTLGTVPDSPLATLVRNNPLGVMSTEGLDYSTLIERLVDFSKTEEHAASLAEIRKLAAGSVRRTVDYFRNSVLPHLRKVIETHTDQFSKDNGVNFPYNIDIRYVPEVYKLPTAQHYVERWENSPAAPTGAAVNLGEYDGEEIVRLARLTEDGDFNSLMTELLKVDGYRGVETISGVLSGRLTVQSIDPIYSLPMAIVLDNIATPKAGLQMTLSDYNAARVMMANTAARKAIALIANLRHRTTNGILYEGVVQADGGTITLVGEVYCEMLEKGLTVEMIVGNELLGRKYFGNAMLDPDNMSKMMEAYERDRGIRQRAQLLESRNRSRQLVLNVLREDQLRIANENAFTVEGDTKEKSWIRLRSIADRVFESNGDLEPSLAISSILLATWYAHTDAARFLNIMFDVEKNNGGLKPAEIANIATTQYIAEWVASQITVLVQDEV